LNVGGGCSGGVEEDGRGLRRRCGEASRDGEPEDMGSQDTAPKVTTKIF
jgi:hypothetical protein